MTDRHKDTQTHTQTHDDGIYRGSIASRGKMKNNNLFIIMLATKDHKQQNQACMLACLQQSVVLNEGVVLDEELVELDFKDQIRRRRHDHTVDNKRVLFWQFVCNCVSVLSVICMHYIILYMYHKHILTC